MMKVIVNSEIAGTAKIWNEVKIVDSFVQDNCSIGDYSQLTKAIIHRNVVIDKNVQIIRSIIDDNSYVNKNTTIIRSDIGKFCLISWNTTLYGGGLDHNLNTLSVYPPYYWKHAFGQVIENDNESPSIKKITIGNNVWIGTGVIILDGVKIGDGAIIAAGSVVTKDVLPYSVNAGNPSKTIRMRYSNDIIMRLLDLKWWDWPEELLKKNEYYLRVGDFNEHVLELLETEKKKL